MNFWRGLWRVDVAVLHRHNATPKTWFQRQPWLPISSTFSIFQPQKVDPYKGMAGAGQPASLLAVATFSAKSLTLPFKTIRKHAFIPLLFPICAALACRFKQGKPNFLVLATP